MNDTREAGRDSVVAARAAHFRNRLHGTGGPPIEVGAGVDTLDAWWKWFLKRFRLPRSSTTERDLQRAGAVPEWYQLRPLPAEELGSELVLLLDGLAAHVAELLWRAEPNAVWVREKDAWFSQPISTLKLPGRPAIPVDLAVVDLGYTALKGDAVSRRPEALRDLVERCLAVGDPRPRLFTSLSRAEATQLLDQVIASQQRQTDLLLVSVQERGGPLAELDYTLNSLVLLWRWLVKRHRLPKRMAMDREMRATHPPWWYDYWPGYGQRLGPDLAGVATGVVAYTATCIQRVVAGTEWTLGTDRLADLRQPVLRVGGLAPVSMYEEVVRLVYGALSGNGDARQPRTLLATAQRWIAAGQRETTPAPAGEPYRVVVIRNEPFDYQITLSEEVAWDVEATTSFLASLRSDSRLARTVHEDREVILVNCRLDEEAFRHAVRAAWEQATG